MGPDGVIEPDAKLADEFLMGRANALRRRDVAKIPGTRDLEPPGLERGELAGPKAEDSPVNRARRRHGEPIEVIGN